jgi:hypothetical protein
MLNSGKKICALRYKKINILPLVLSEKKFWMIQKTITVFFNSTYPVNSIAKEIFWAEIYVIVTYWMMLFALKYFTMTKLTTDFQGRIVRPPLQSHSNPAGIPWAVHSYLTCLQTKKDWLRWWDHSPLTLTF